MVGLALLFLALAAAGPVGAALKAGAAKTVITPDLHKFSPVYMAGFGNNRVATGVHDDLYARCLALSVTQRPLVLCGVDSIGLFVDDVDRIRAEVNRKLNPLEADVVVAALHDHESPDAMGLWGPAEGRSGINEAYNTFIVDRVAETAVNAVHALRPATVSLRGVRSPELDSFIHDDRPPEVHDADLMVLSAKDSDGATIATLVNWANHPETLGSKNTLITADYPAALYSILEGKLGGIAVFLNGAVGGMQSPGDAIVNDPATGEPAKNDSFRKAEIIGVRLAQMAADAVASAKPVTIDKIQFREKRIRIPVSNAGFLLADKAGIYKGRKKMGEDHSTTVPVGLIRLGSGDKPTLEIALVPGELYPELSVGGVERYPGADFPDAPIEPAIKRQMTADFRMLVGLADDEIGYIIPKAEWDEKPPYLQNAKNRWYGEVNSVGPEAAPLIAAALSEMLQTAF